MELLEKYLYQVGRFLPRKEKQDTLDELKSIILDQVDQLVASGKSEDEAVLEVLTEMGEPLVVAYKYRNTQPLINLELEQLLWLILKIPAIAIPIALLVAKTVEYLANTDNVNILEVLQVWALTIPNIILILIMVSGSIFFVFLLISKYGTDLDISTKQKAFNPKHLPPAPKKLFKANKYEMWFILLASVVFMAFLNINQSIFLIADADGVRTPFFNEELTRIIPFININILLAMIIAAYHLYKGKKTKLSKTFEFIHTLFSAVILYTIGTTVIFNDVLINVYHLEFLQNGFSMVMYALAIFTVIGGLVEFIKTLIEVD